MSLRTDILVIPNAGSQWVLAIDGGAVVRMSPRDPRVRVGKVIHTTSTHYRQAQP